MAPNIEQAEKKAEEIRLKYNPDGLSPFPHQKIVEDSNSLLRISFFDLEDDSIWGAIGFDTETNSFSIFINSTLSKSEQYLTLAYELGHFFLHQALVKEETIIFDGEESIGGNKIFSVAEESIKSDSRREANIFASNLIMPKDLVIQAWDRLKTVEDCASVFNVSFVEMAIRLKSLGLTKEE